MLFSDWTSPLAYEMGAVHCTGGKVQTAGVQELKRPASRLQTRLSCFMTRLQPPGAPWVTSLTAVPIVSTQPFYAFDYFHFPDVKLET